MSQSDSLAGRVIGNYEIIRELGRGGMGVVYKAHEQSLQRVVALKILPRHLAENPALVKRFLREARAGARLNHPNIVTTHAVGEHDGVYFIAMEYIKGAPLSQVIREQGQLGIGRALDICRQAAQALGEAHAQGIIHRDIKPQNMMIDQMGRVKVMDFGLAKVLHAETELTAENARLGTPLYMSPEQAQGHTVDAHTDIYSLGIVLFEMLAGAPPFLAESPVAVLHQIIHRPLPDLRALNSDVPVPVAQLVARMTAKNPEDRHPSAEALDRDLATVSSGGEKTVLTQNKVRKEAPSVRIEPQQIAAPPTKASFPQRRFIVAVVLVLAGVCTAFSIGKLTGVSSPNGQEVPVQDMGGKAVPVVGASDIPSAHEEPASAVTTPSAASTQPEPVLSSPEIPGGVQTVLLLGDVPLEMVWIPPGTFMMGSPDNELGLKAGEGPQHQVTLSQGFWMGKYEVTQGQWEAVMGSNPSSFKGDTKLPVDTVNWHDCQTFIEKMNKNGVGVFRLPTEAEWEYACRAGTTTQFYWGNDPSGTQIGDYTWYVSNSGKNTHPVGGKQPNAFGLYDMSGNVWEWCQDWFGSYSTGSVTDPAGATSGTFKVLRGGAWRSNPQYCHSDSRCLRSSPDIGCFEVGLRVVRSPGKEVAAAGTADTPQPLKKPAGATPAPPAAPIPVPPPPVPVMTGHLQVAVNVPKAVVKVDGKPAGKAELNKALEVKDLPSGKVDIEVSAEGYESQERVVNIKRGDWTQETFELVKIVVTAPSEQRPRAVAPPAKQQIQVSTGTSKPGETQTFAGIEMVWIPPGTFMMGSSDNEEGRRLDNEGPQHQVTLSQGFWMGKYEVTQDQWEAVMDSNPSAIKGDTKLPVEQVSWDDCQAFIQKVNGKGEGTFRLPSEAEWEYACRAGTATRFYWGDDPSNTQIENYEWYRDNSGSSTHPVGGKLPNAWGLYDMSGNILEWCQDWYGNYPSGPATDPTGPTSDTFRMWRGGTFQDYPQDCRSACRLRYPPAYGSDGAGFRVVRTP